MKENKHWMVSRRFLILKNQNHEQAENVFIFGVAGMPCAYAIETCGYRNGYYNLGCWRII